MLCLNAQISPPGLGLAKTAGWFAVGMRQKLDTMHHNGWQSMTYAGAGFKSSPDNHHFFGKPGIIILNQEFYHQFHKTWTYSLAISYRRQFEYKDEPPYDYKVPKLRQEFRVYGRLMHHFSFGIVRLVPTFRQEFRKFYSPDFRNVSENFQLRTRFRIQLAVSLDHKKQHKFTAASEQLFSVSKSSDTKKWTDFNYRESRFSVFYTISPVVFPFSFSIGYMNNLVGLKSVFDVHILAADFILENPFQFFKKRKEKSRPSGFIKSSDESDEILNNPRIE